MDEYGNIVILTGAGVSVASGLPGSGGVGAALVRRPGLCSARFSKIGAATAASITGWPATKLVRETLNPRKPKCSLRKTPPLNADG